MDLTPPSSETAVASRHRCRRAGNYWKMTGWLLGHMADFHTYIHREKKSKPKVKDYIRDRYNSIALCFVSVKLWKKRKKKYFRNLRMKRLMKGAGINLHLYRNATHRREKWIIWVDRESGFNQDNHQDINGNSKNDLPIYPKVSFHLSYFFQTVWLSFFILFLSVFILFHFLFCFFLFFLAFFLSF